MKKYKIEPDDGGELPDDMPPTVPTPKKP